MITQLLPSQKTLLTRLALVDYASTAQLKLISGDSGAGKSTLIAAELTENTSNQSALIRCGKEQNPQDLRQQLLIQLVPAGIFFDDERPLTETIVALENKLNFPLKIAIDDAHFLPAEIWQECLDLIQITFKTKTTKTQTQPDSLYYPIKLIASLNNQFIAKLEQLFMPNHWRLIRIIDIPPLSLLEQQWLYQHLLSQHKNAIPRQKIVSINQDELITLSTPQAVVNFFNDSVSCQKQPVQVVVNKLINKLTNKVANQLPNIASTVLFIPILYMILFALPTNSMSNTPLHTSIATPIDKANINAVNPSPMPANSKALKSIASKPEHSNFIQGYFLITDPIMLSSLAVDKANMFNQSPHALDFQALSFNTPFQSELYSTHINQAEALLSKPMVVTKLTKPSTTKIKATNTKTISNNNNLTDIQDKKSVVSHQQLGYTLQIASLKQFSSVNNLLKTLAAEPNVFIARNKQRWVVTQGNYSQKALARNQANRLIQRYQIEKPLLKKWSSFKDYTIEPLSRREIPR